MASNSIINLSQEIRAHLQKLGAELGQFASFGQLAGQIGALPPDIELPSAGVTVEFSGNLPSELGIGAEDRRRQDLQAFSKFSTRSAMVAMMTALEQYTANLLFIVSIGQLGLQCKGVISGGQYQCVGGQVQETMSRKGVDGLLKELYKRLGHRWPPSDKDYVLRLLSLNHLRHCLVHRAGRIGKRDTGGGSCLEVSLVTLQLFCGDQAVTSLPFYVEKGQAVTLRRQLRVRSWRLGEMVQLLISA